MSCNNAADVAFCIETAQKLIEDIYEKDIALCSSDEICKAFERSYLYNIGSIRSILASVSKYFVWCIETRAFPIFRNEAKYVKIHEIDCSNGIVHCFIRSPEDLICKLRNVYSDDSGQEVIPTIIFKWIGLSYNEIINLRNEDVDLQNAQIHVNSDAKTTVYNIPSVFIESLNIYKNTNVSERSAANTWTVYADDIGFFVKKMLAKNSKKAGKSITVKQLRDSVYRFSVLYSDKKNDIFRFDQDSIEKSALCYKLYQLEMSGEDISSKELIYKLTGYVSSALYKDLLTLYKTYKKVFYSKYCEVLTQ